MQPLFPKGCKPGEMWKSLRVPRPFQLNSCKNFKNRDRMIVSRIELSLWKMMSSIILSPEHHQNNKWSKLLGKTQIWPEKLIQEWCWTVNHFCYGFCHLAFCFGVTSHPWTKHIFSWSFCCFEIKRCFFQRVFWQKYFFDQTPKLKLVNPED
jgi:hypothetical protein